MIWRLRDLPELSCLELPQRSALLSRVSRTARWRLWQRAMIAGAFVGLAVMIVAAEMYRGPWLWLVFAAAWVVATLVFYQLIIKRVRHALRRELATAFVGRPPICFACGYDLRGHATALCPECGRRDHPSTRPASAARTLGRFVGKTLLAAPKSKT